LVFPPNHVDGLRLNFEENNPVDWDVDVASEDDSSFFLKGAFMDSIIFPKKEGVGGGTGAGPVP
jgi:hypothetical protein